MAASVVSASIDSRIAARADRQHGNITTAQLLGFGLSRAQISKRVPSGRLHPVYRGVYAVGRPAKTALERAAAAVLACGEEALLSQRSGLALWEVGSWPRRMHVTVPGNRRPAGITVHRCTRLLPRDTRTHQGIRVTSPARTLLDAAPTLTGKQLARAVNDLRRRKKLRLTDIEDIVTRFPRHPGAARLRRFVHAKGGPTRSDWEDAFPAFCKLYGLPEPILDTKVAGHEADAFFPGHKLIVELDGWDFHQSREAFESDRDRDADALAAGHPTVRITWERMHERGAAEAARLHQILANERR